MTSPSADVALLTDRRYTAAVAPEGDWYLGNILREDELVRAALGQLGLTSARVDWADPAVDWSRFRCAVFRTTWDYFDRLPEFLAWLDRVGRQTRLCNDPATVRWNLDKHYLRDLEHRGVPVVPTHYIDRGSGATLAGLLAATGWAEAVVKPCVSGAARHTYRVNRATADAVQAVVGPLLAAESFLLQPFLRDVVRTGEDTLMVLDGRVTHAVRKVAKAGDFRVQDDHGGTVHDHSPTPEQIALAERAVAACAPAPSYGRVDMVRDDEGRLAVMELELIEPELWLRNHPPAATALAEAIGKVLAGR
jgi:glutathione synthase/RimK-type ligase-like ATP-grasp enzyme